jgi:hypothetical protein
MRSNTRNWQLIYAQMEIIKSLQMAAQHETAILNLRLLHEASITNRKDTFVILDEMKQRIVMTRPIPRQIEGGSPLLLLHFPRKERRRITNLVWPAISR